MYRNFSLRELCGLLAWIFPMIKIRGLVKLLPAEARDGGRWVGTFIQLVKGSSARTDSVFHHTAESLCSLPSFPRTPGSWWWNRHVSVFHYENTGMSLKLTDSFLTVTGRQAYLVLPGASPFNLTELRAAGFTPGRKLPALLSTMPLNENCLLFFQVSFQYWWLWGRETKSSVFRMACSLSERFQGMILINPAAGFKNHQINAHKDSSLSVA